MDYSSLKASMKPVPKPRRRSTSNQTGNSANLDKNLLASKLFSYLICHGEDCRLAITDAAKRLQKFSDDRGFDKKKALEFVKCFREKFDVKNVEGKEFVEARTLVKICDAFQQGTCKATGCNELHVCRFFLEGAIHIKN